MGPLTDTQETLPHARTFKRWITAGFWSRSGDDTDKCDRNLRERSLLKEIGCLKIERILWEGAANLNGGDWGEAGGGG